jgi:hypothetical protein
MEKRKKGPGNILQCLVALFFISVTGSGAERSGAEMEKRKKGPGNILQCLVALFFNSVTGSGAERSGAEMELLVPMIVAWSGSEMGLLAM